MGYYTIRLDLEVGGPHGTRLMTKTFCAKNLELAESGEPYRLRTFRIAQFGHP